MYLRVAATTTTKITEKNQNTNSIVQFYYTQHMMFIFSYSKLIKIVYIFFFEKLIVIFENFEIVCLSKEGENH